MKRHKWLNAGLRRVEDAEIVFFDPDNGLEIPSRSSKSLMGPKYVYYDDLQSCWERGQSLVVYHHVGRTYRGRKADAGEQITRDFPYWESSGSRGSPNEIVAA